MSTGQIYEGRRYSAVLLLDPRVGDLSRVAGLLQMSNSSTATLPTSGDWTAIRATYAAGAPYFPNHRETQADADSWDYELFVAQDAMAGLTLIAAPYVDLLSECLTGLDRSLSESGLRFARPTMSSIFEHFELHTYDNVIANRITVQMSGDAGVERVALTGRNPLRSDLRHALLSVATPYAIRIRATTVPDLTATNVFVDRHGNLAWHLYRQPSFANVLRVMDILGHVGAFRPTTTHPLRRMDEDD